MTSSAIKDLHYNFGLALVLARDTPEVFYLGQTGLTAKLDSIAKVFNPLQGSPQQVVTFPRFMSGSPITKSYPSFDQALLHGLKYEIFGFHDAERQIIPPTTSTAQHWLDARYTPHEAAVLLELTRAIARGNPSP